MGIAFYKFEISTVMNMQDSLTDSKSSLDKEVEKIHNQLPYGTKLVGIERDVLITSLMLKYVAIFEHPIFINDSEIKDLTEYKRDIGFDSSDDPKECRIYAFDRSDRLNFDDFINKEPPKDR